MLPLLLLLAQAGLAPEQLRLGEELARSGTLATILPAMVAKDADELVRDHPELSAAEQAELRRVALEMAEASAARLYRAMGDGYARRLSAEDMRALIAWNTGPLARRYRAAELPTVAEAMGKLGGMDLKKDSMAAFCAKTGKLCARR